MKPPLKATIFSSLSFGSSLTIYYLFFISNDVWFMLSMISGYFILTLPILLIFTIKQKGTKKSVVQPPRALQFHNEDLRKGISYPLQFHENFDTIEHYQDCEMKPNLYNAKTICQPKLYNSLDDSIVDINSDVIEHCGDKGKSSRRNIINVKESSVNSCDEDSRLYQLPSPNNELEELKASKLLQPQ
jgi:hypothetical protein